MHLPQLTCTTSCMDWILQRKVLPGRITIGKFMTETDAILLSEVTSAVQEIHMTDLQGYEHRLKITCLQKLAAFSPQLKKVVWHPDEDSLGGSATYRLHVCSLRTGSRSLLLIANTCPVLTHIKICDRSFSLKNFRTILSKCRNISTVDIRYCTQLLTGRSLAIIGDLCPQLEVLTVNNTSRLDDHVLDEIARKCSKLRCLRILEADRHYDHDEAVQGFPPIIPSGFSNLTKNCPPLETLHLSCVQASYNDITRLFVRCPKLKHLMRCPVAGHSQYSRFVPTWRQSRYSSSPSSQLRLQVLWSSTVLSCRALT